MLVYSMAHALLKLDQAEKDCGIPEMELLVNVDSERRILDCRTEF